MKNFIASASSFIASGFAVVKSGFNRALAFGFALVTGITAALFGVAPANAADPEPTIGQSVMEAVNLDGLETDITTILTFATVVLVGFVAFKIIKRALNRA